MKFVSRSSRLFLCNSCCILLLFIHLHPKFVVCSHDNPIQSHRFSRRRHRHRHRGGILAMNEQKQKTATALDLRRMTAQAAGAATTHGDNTHILVDDNDATTRTIIDAAAVAASTTTIPKKSRQRDSGFLYSNLMAGLGSGIASSFICAPFDLVRVRIQVWEQVTGHTRGIAIPNMIATIVRESGVPGLFRGLTATLVTVPSFWGVYCMYDGFFFVCAFGGRNTNGFRMFRGLTDFLYCFCVCVN